YIHHPFIAVGCDNYKAVPIFWLAAVTPELTKSGKVHWLVVTPVNVIRLLSLRIILILHPLIPPIRWHDAAPRFPYRLEEFTGGRSLASGIYGRRTFALSPKRLPAPAHQVPARPDLGAGYAPLTGGYVVTVDGFWVDKVCHWHV